MFCFLLVTLAQNENFSKYVYYEKANFFFIILRVKNKDLGIII